MLRQAESYFPLSSTPNVKLFAEIVRTGLLVHDSFITLAYSLELTLLSSELVADCTSTGRTPVQHKGFAYLHSSLLSRYVDQQSFQAYHNHLYQLHEVHSRSLLLK